MVKPENQIIISLSDLWIALKKNRWMILGVSLSLMFFACYLHIMRSGVHYLAEGSVKPVGTESSSFAGKFLSMTSGGAVDSYLSSGDNPKLLLASYPVAESIVKKLYLQGHIAEIGHSQQKNSLYQSLLCFKAQHFFGRCAPISACGKTALAPSREESPFSVVESPLFFRRLIYNQEGSSTIKIHFLDDTHFVTSEGKEGSIDQPFTMDRFTFTLGQQEPSCAGRDFILNFSPLEPTAKKLAQCIKVEEGVNKRKHLVELSCKQRDPKLAALIVNSFVDEYLNYLKKQGNDKIRNQLSYLASREEELLAKMRTITKAQAAFAKNEMEQGSFTLLGDPKSASLSYMAACKTYADLSLKIQSTYESLYGVQRSVKDILLEIGSTTTALSSQSATATLTKLAQQTEELELKFEQYDNLLQLIDQEDFQLHALSQSTQALLTDGEITRLSRLAAGPNTTAKEREFATNQMRAEKAIIRERLTQLIKIEKEDCRSIKVRIKQLQKVLLGSLLRELSIIENDVGHYLVRCGEHVDQALFEHNAFLNKEALSRFQGELLTMAESKNMAYHMESIGTTPFERASIPILPAPPKLKKWGVIGAILGLFFSFAFIVLKEVYLGLRASAVNLNALGRRVVDDEESSIELLQEEKSWAIIGKECRIAPTLAKKLCFAGKKPLLFYLSGKGPSCLEKLNIKEKGGIAKLELGKVPDWAVLQSAAFIECVEELKQKYDRIIFVANLKQSRQVSALADHVLFAVTNERIPELGGLPEDALYLHEESQPLEKKSLKEALNRLAIPSSSSFSECQDSS